MSNKLVAKEETTTALSLNPFSADVDSSDIDIPRINVVQKTSDIYGPDGEPAPYGSLVIDKTYVLAKPDTDIRVIPLIAQKSWREDIPYDSDEMPRIANSEEQRAALESESNYPLLEFAEITLLFKGTEEQPETYPLPIGKEFYAIGRINVAKDAYRQTFKRLYTFRAFNKQTPLYSREWNFKSSLISRGKYSWYAPMISVSSDDSSKEVQDFVEGLLS